MKNKLFLVSSSMLLALILGSCGGETPTESSSEPAEETSVSSESESASSESEPIESESTSEELSEEKPNPRVKQEMPTAEIIDADTDFGDPSSWAGTQYTSQSLGYVYLQDVISDDVYDWGHSILFEDGVYKMWWVRPAVYDAIFYAESTDLKNWVNVQRVLCLSPNATNIKKYANIKGMLGKPSVVHVGDTYYMYFEAPATEDPDLSQTVLEWDNQVMLATSKDGISWEFHCDEQGEPTPVVAMNDAFMKDGTKKNYGEGQPSVFYKDGTFYLTYCHVIYAPGDRENGIYLATSKDGVNFGDPSTHKRISSGNGLGVTYNERTGKYMKCTNSTIVESATLDFTGDVQEYPYCEYNEMSTVRNFPEFIRNPHGLVDKETFYVISLQGERSTTEDWRANYRTWDGYIYAMNPCEFENRPIELPNGAKLTENNLKGYKERKNTYSKPTADAIYASDSSIKIDCVKDAAYENATRVEISRPVYDYGSDFTSTWGEAYVAWNEQYLYVYANIYDTTHDVSYGLLNHTYLYMHDSLDVFVDAVHDYGTGVDVPYDIEQYMIGVDSNNEEFCIKGSNEFDMTDEFSGVRHRVKLREFGYDVEFRVPWHELVTEEIYENKVIGLDFQINDARNNGVGREASVVWSDHTGNSFRFVDKMGDFYLVK